MKQVEPAASPGSLRRRLLHALPFPLLFFLTVFVYLNAIKGDFVFDDVKLVRDNPWIRSWSDTFAAFDIFSDRWEKDEVRANYRPVRFLSYAVDWHVTRALWPGEEKLRPTIFHLHNILLHALNSLLLFLLLRRLLNTGTAFTAFLTLLWTLHPVQTESVTYISGRRDVLFTAFFLGAVLVHLSERERWWKTCLVAALYGAALLTKEMAVTLPAVLLSADLFRRRRFTGRRIAGHVVLWLLFAAYAAFKLGIKNPGGGAPPWGGSFFTALLTEGRAVFLYLRLVFFPVSLSVDWSYAAIRPSSGFLDPWITLPALLLLLALGVFVLRRFLRKRDAFSFGILLFFITLSPVMQLVPHPERFAERYLYLPLLGLIVAAFPLLRALARSPTARVLGLILILFYCGRTVRRNKDWKNDFTLWKSAVSVNPACARAHFALGLALNDRSAWSEAAENLDLVFRILADKKPLTPLEKGQLLQAHIFRAQAFSRLGEEKYPIPPPGGSGPGNIER